MILAADRTSHITSLEMADSGNFPAFVRYLGRFAAVRSEEAAECAEFILSGLTH